MRVRKSPKKRKNLKRATGGTVGLYTKEVSDNLSNGLLDSDNWFGHLLTTIETSFPDILKSDCLTNVEKNAVSESSETEYEVDLNSLEISQILKRKKRSEETLQIQVSCSLVQQNDHIIVIQLIFFSNVTYIFEFARDVALASLHLRC